jgi:hypothetical protein
MTASIHQQPWRFRDVEPTMTQTQVCIFGQETREYIGKLGMEKAAIERRYSAIFSDPGESLECAFVSFLCCRKM